MANSCCPANPTAAPAVPTSSTCFDGHSIRNAIRLPSSCRSRTWQLVTHQENRKRPNSAPVSSEPVSCPPTCFPETSCVGFLCQPIGSHTACCASNASGAPHPAASPQPSCLESSVCDNSPGHQGSGPDCTSGSCQTACSPSGCDDRSCQPPCSEATSCVESPCLPASCEATSCQPTCCQGGSQQPIKGEGQLCKSVYYQPVCYVLQPRQPAPCLPLTCMCHCSQICCVPSPCQPLHCQPAPPVSFICQPVAPCQHPCFVKSGSKSRAKISGQPTCGGPTSNGSGCHSPPCQPPCCVTGVGRPSSGGPSCRPPTSPNVCQAGTCMPTS
ncbi:keratin-associated protein 29-1 [Meriones unguiculatus]|uniref:keratin-associated protein 29-1 n=1 Tax=Meriones unguiculatus TaxID=10047 RepID=UPI00293F3124|nr:keratin-associated protein 29-1 [Meriones unguiculatus]